MAGKADDARTGRLKVALKANLRRRKAQARGRLDGSPAPPEEPEQPPEKPDPNG